MPKAKNDVHDMSINEPLQKISVKMTFYFSIVKPSILDFFWEILRRRTPRKTPGGALGSPATIRRRPAMVFFSSFLRQYFVQNLLKIFLIPTYFHPLKFLKTCERSFKNHVSSNCSSVLLHGRAFFLVSLPRNFVPKFWFFYSVKILKISIGKIGLPINLRF